MKNIFRSFLEVTAIPANIDGFGRSRIRFTKRLTFWEKRLYQEKEENKQKTLYIYIYIYIYVCVCVCVCVCYNNKGNSKNLKQE